MADFREKFKNIKGKVKQKSSTVSSIFNKYILEKTLITPYYKFRSDIVEQSKVSNNLLNYDDNFNKSIKITKDLIQSEGLMVPGVKQVEFINENTNSKILKEIEELEKELEHKASINDYNGINDIRKEIEELKGKSITTDRLAIGKIEPTPQVSNPSVIKKISELERHYIEAITKPRTIRRTHGAYRTILPTIRRERLQDSHLEMANEVRRDINHIRNETMTKFNFSRLRETFDNVNNTQEFNSLIANNEQFANSYLNLLRNKTQPVIDRIHKINNDELNDGVGTFKPHKRRFQEFQQLRADYVNPESVYNQNVYNPTSYKAKKINFDKFGMKTIPKESVRFHEKKLMNELRWFASEGSITDYKIEDAALGGGMSGRKVSFRVIKNGKNIYFEKTLPKTTNGQIRFEKGGTNWITGLVGVRTAPNVEALYDGETLALNNFTQHLEKIIEETEKGGAEYGSKKADKLMKIHMDEHMTPALGNVSDVSKKTSYHSATIRKLLTGEFKGYAEKNMIAAKSMINMHNAKTNGAWYVAYDIETVIDDPRAGTQLIASRNNVGVYNIGVSIYDNKGQLVDYLNLYHDPKNINIRSKESREIMEGLIGEKGANKVVADVTKYGKSKREILLEINKLLKKRLTDRGVPYYLVNKNGTGFDNLILSNFFSNLHGGEFMGKLNNAALSIDVDAVSKFISGEDKGNKLAQIVRRMLGQDGYKAFKKNFGNRLISLSKNLKKTNMISKGLEGFEHTPIMDNELAMQAMFGLTGVHGLGESQSLYNQYEQLFSKSTLSLKEKMRLIKLVTSGPLFLGAPGASQAIKLLLNYGSVSPNRGIKGIPSQFDISKMTPFGIFNSLERQLYQSTNGTSIKGWSKKEVEAYKRTHGFHPFQPVFSTEFAENIMQSMDTKSYSKYGIRRERAPVQNVFFSLNKNAQTLEESYRVSKSIARSFVPQETLTKKFDFDMPIVANNLDSLSFHENIFGFQRLRSKIIDKYRKIERYKNLPQEEIEKLASKEARRIFSRRGLKIKAGEEFLRFGLRTKDGKSINKNETGVDLDILDTRLLTDTHIIDGKEVKVITGIVGDFQNSEGLIKGDKMLVGGMSSKGTIGNIVEDMFTRHYNPKIGRYEKILVGTHASEAKFFKRGEFGGLFQILLGNALWHDQFYNKGSNIKTIMGKINITLGKHGLSHRITNVGDVLSDSLMNGIFDLKTLTEIYQLVGLTYAKGESENIRRALNIHKDIDFNKQIKVMDDVAREISKKVDLRNTTFETQEQAYKHLSEQLRTIPEQLKNGGAKFLWKTDSNDVGFMGIGLRTSIEDRIQAGPQLGPHDIRLSAIEKMKHRFFGTERKEYLKTLFDKTTGGEEKKNLQTLVDIDFATRHFLGLEDRSGSKFASKVTEINKKQVMAMVDQFQRNVFNGDNIHDLKYETFVDFFGHGTQTQFKEFKEKLLQQKSVNKTMKDLAGTFFDKQLQGNLFEIDLGRDMDINVGETIHRALSRGFTTPELEKDWERYRKELGLKDKIRISRKQFIVNPVLLMEEQADDRLFHPSKAQMQFTNFTEKLKAFWEGNDNVDELKLDYLKYMLMSFNGQMGKKEGLFGKATEATIKGAQARAISSFDSMTLKYVREGKLNFYHNTIGVQEFNELRRKFAPHDFNTMLDKTFGEYRKTTDGNVTMTDWLVREFAPGKQAIPVSLERYPAEQNRPMIDMLYHIIDSDKKGLRPNQAFIPVSPLMFHTKQGDFDADRVAVAIFGYKNLEEMSKRAKNVEDRFIQKDSNGTISIRPEWRTGEGPENVVNYINDKNIRIGNKQERLYINPDGKLCVKNFSGDPDLIMTDIVRDSRVLGALGWGKFTQKGKEDFIQSQQKRALNQIFSKIAIPEVTTKALRAPIETLLYLASNGDKITLSNLIEKSTGKFNKRTLNLYDDLRTFAQGILDIKSVQSNSENLIQQKLNDLANFSKLSSETARKELMSKGYFVNTMDLLEEVMDFHKGLSKELQFQSQRRLMVGQNGGTILDLLTSLSNLGDTESALGGLEDILGYAGAKRPVIAKQMQQGFLDRFKETYGKEQGENLVKYGKYAGIGALAYLGLNLFRSNQMSNKYNPLDLFVDLGPQEGVGGEEYDYFSENYGLGRTTPLDIPQTVFDEKTRIILDDPYSEEKREIRSIFKLEELLNREELGMISVPYNKQTNSNYYSNLSKINRLTINDLIAKGNVVMR